MHVFQIIPKLIDRFRNEELTRSLKVELLLGHVHGVREYLMHKQEHKQSMYLQANVR